MLVVGLGLVFERLYRMVKLSNKLSYVHTTQRKNLECTFSSGDNDRSRNSVVALAVILLK